MRAYDWKFCNVLIWVYSVMFKNSLFPENASDNTVPNFKMHCCKEFSPTSKGNQFPFESLDNSVNEPYGRQARDQAAVLKTT